MTGGICEPFRRFPWINPDPRLNRQSARRLAALEPALACFGHGPPARDQTLFAAAVSRLAS
jgi:hydroxyacylglutathione hydrolase